MGGARSLRSKEISPVARLVVATLLGVVAGDYASAQLGYRSVHPDVGQVWYAARAVLQGLSPYDVIGPGRAFQWEAPLFYPLPAALVAMPLAPLSEAHAVFVFVALGIGAFSWAVTEHGWGGLWAVTSICVQHAVLIAQWSPLLAGAVVLAPLSVVLVAKPTVGVAVFAARPSWWAIGSAIVLIALAFLLQPDWVSAWRTALGATVGGGGRYPYLAPVMQPGGFLILLALSRWRRPEARLLAVLACVPQTTLPYEGVLLFLIPRGWRQMLSLTVLSWAMVGFVRQVMAPQQLVEGVRAYAPAFVAFLYLPGVIMILRRPNSGAVPPWIERAVGGVGAHIRRRTGTV